MNVLLYLGVDSGPGWTGMGPKGPPGPNLGLNYMVHTDPNFTCGLHGFGLIRFAGSRLDLVGFTGCISRQRNF
jgi:hypothetical protein